MTVARKRKAKSKSNNAEAQSSQRKRRGKRKGGERRRGRLTTEVTEGPQGDGNSVEVVIRRYREQREVAETKSGLSGNSENRLSHDAWWCREPPLRAAEGADIRPGWHPKKDEPKTQVENRTWGTRNATRRIALVGNLRTDLKVGHYKGEIRRLSYEGEILDEELLGVGGERS